MKEIVSRQNAKFKVWLKLLEARGIKAEGRALLSGRKQIEEFLSERPDQALELLTPDKTDLNFSPEHTYLLSNELFRELDVFGTKAPLLVVHVPPIEKWSASPARGLELVVALSDPGNLGAVLRSADAFGVKKIILCEEACSPYLPKALRAASGSTFRLKYFKAGPLQSLTFHGSVAALDMSGEALTRWTWPKDLQLVVGEEGRGVPKELHIPRVCIPMKGQTESLNAMAATSIALFSYSSTHTPK